MDTRELDPEEWASFFDAFSRHYRGRLVTLEVGDGPSRDGWRNIARRVPLVGVTAERHAGEVRAIEIIVGASIDDHLMHVVNAPSRVGVSQVSNGQDEVLIIESAADGTLRIDFSETPVGPSASPARAGSE